MNFSLLNFTHILFDCCLFDIGKNSIIGQQNILDAKVRNSVLAEVAKVVTFCS